jgi:hypothetical protein
MKIIHQHQVLPVGDVIYCVANQNKTEAAAVISVAVILPGRQYFAFQQILHDYISLFYGPQTSFGPLLYCRFHTYLDSQVT